MFNTNTNRVSSYFGLKVVVLCQVENYSLICCGNRELIVHENDRFLGLIASDLAARSSASRILKSCWSIVLLRVCLTFEFSSRRRRSAGTRG